MQRPRKLFVTLMFLLAALAPQVWSQSQARIVRISDVEGQVDFDNGHGYDNTTLNFPVTEGNRISTHSDGWAEVQFEDGSTLRVAPETEIVFSELKLSGDGGTITAIDLNWGEAEFKVIRHDLGSFQVNVHQKAIVLRQTGAFRISTSNSNPLDLAVWRGEVGVNDSASGEEVVVRKNESFVLDPLDVARYNLENGAEADDLDQWSNQRDEYLAQNASNTNAVQSPYQYGMGDLAQYGEYYNVDGYGPMWRPYGVSFDWDPFLNGNWSPTPYGYTWVSAYRWGWIPYRYGQWVFIAGRGWLWKPGQWHHWQRVPEFVHGPPHFHMPALPPQGVTQPRIAVAPGPVRPPVHVGVVDTRGSGVPSPLRAPGRRVGDHIYSGGPVKRVITNDDIDEMHRAQGDKPFDKTTSPRSEHPSPDDQRVAQQEPRVPDKTTSPRYERPSVDDQKTLTPPQPRVPDKATSPRYERPSVADTKPPAPANPTPPSAPPTHSYSPPPSPPARSNPPPPAPTPPTHSAPEHASPPAHTDPQSGGAGTANTGSSSNTGGTPKR